MFNFLSERRAHLLISLRSAFGGVFFPPLICLPEANRLRVSLHSQHSLTSVPSTSLQLPVASETVIAASLSLPENFTPSSVFGYTTNARGHPSPSQLIPKLMYYLQMCYVLLIPWLQMCMCWWLCVCEYHGSLIVIQCLLDLAISHTWQCIATGKHLCGS